MYVIEIRIVKNKENMVWIFLCLQDPYVEVLTPKATVLGGKAFERWLDHEARALMIGISAHIKETPEN